MQLVAAGTGKLVFFKPIPGCINYIYSRAGFMLRSSWTVQTGLHIFGLFVLVCVCAFFSFIFIFQIKNMKLSRGFWRSWGTENNMIKYNAWDFFFTKEKRKMIFKTLEMDRNSLRDIQAHKSTLEGKRDTMMGVRQSTVLFGVAWVLSVTFSITAGAQIIYNEVMFWVKDLVLSVCKGAAGCGEKEKSWKGD